MNAEEMLAEHVRVERLLCGARAMSDNEEHVFGGGTKSRRMVCTLPLGHEPELHADGRCCYAVHRFAVATEQVIEDWSQCAKCGERWPCQAVRIGMAFRAEGVAQ